MNCFHNEEGSELNSDFYLRWRQSLSQTLTIGNVVIPGLTYEYIDKQEIDDLVEISIVRKREINKEIKQYNEYMKEQETKAKRENKK